MAAGLKNLLPLLILLVVIGVLAAVGLVAYTIMQEVSNQTRAKMEKKHIMFNKDGLKVEVKEVTDEAYKDRSQSVLVNMWNHTSFPAYKSRIWGNGSGASKRKW
ncbi:hypothetical protein Plec18167_000129 [Paecilomyces lecythidis]|uniref:Uncharacterized protein n=1 Tax=Paecilomyces lecythidis TaxID=3004212 RepID=A0ABR3YE01_9EURO